MSDIKYCEDCAMYRAAASNDPASAVCLKPRNASGLQLVARGANRPRNCESERMIAGYTDSCGPDAQWFEPKQPKEPT